MGGRVRKSKTSRLQGLVPATINRSVQDTFQTKQYSMSTQYDGRKNQSLILESLVGSKVLSPIILNVSRQILGRNSIFKCTNPTSSAGAAEDPMAQSADSPFESAKMPLFTADQVTSSYTYRKLEQKIKEMEKARISNLESHRLKMENITYSVAHQKKQQQQLKLSLWELKNELMELEEIYEEEIIQINQLEGTYDGEEGEDGEYEGRQQDEENQEYHEQDCGTPEEEPNPSANIVSEMYNCSSIGSSQCAEKPACSIKEMIRAHRRAEQSAFSPYRNAAPASENRFDSQNMLERARIEPFDQDQSNQESTYQMMSIIGESQQQVGAFLSVPSKDAF